MKATARSVFECCIVGAAIVAAAGDGKGIPPPERAANASPVTNAVAAANTAGIVVTNAADAALVKEIEEGVVTLADDIAEERKWGYDRISDASCKKGLLYV